MAFANIFNDFFYLYIISMNDSLINSPSHYSSTQTTRNSRISRKHCNSLFLTLTIPQEVLQTILSLQNTYSILQVVIKYQYVY